jgi:hypothetical protein
VTAIQNHSAALRQLPVYGVAGRAAEQKRDRHPLLAGAGYDRYVHSVFVWFSDLDTSASFAPRPDQFVDAVINKA